MGSEFLGIGGGISLVYCILTLGIRRMLGVYVRIINIMVRIWYPISHSYAVRHVIVFRDVLLLREKSYIVYREYAKSSLYSITSTMQQSSKNFNFNFIQTYNTRHNARPSHPRYHCQK